MLNNLGKIVLVFFLGVSINSFAADEGFYIGAAFGINSNDDLFTNNNTNANIVVNIDDSSSAGKIFAGYNINEYFGVEFAWHNLGRFDATQTVIATGVEVASITAKFSGYTIAGVARYPINYGYIKNLDIFAKVGAFIWEYDLENRVTNTEDNDDGTDIMFGLGLNYNVYGDIDLRLEWERVSIDNTDNNILSFGFSYNF